MCGIIGKAGDSSVIPDLMDGLERLEYRGYDSAGFAVHGKNGFEGIKTAGRISALREALDARGCAPGRTGIGHTRWATHGAPTDANAHPHYSPDGVFAVVHNGIIENAEELKRTLLPPEERYASDTDTEVAAHLLGKYYKGDPIAALSETAAVLKGSFALGVLCADFPDSVFACALSSPLFAVRGDSGCYIASDTGAVKEDAREVYRLENGEMCRITRDTIELFTPEGVPFGKEREKTAPGKLRLEKSGYGHYMLMEIMQQPQAVGDTLKGLIKDGRVGKDTFPDDAYIKEKLENIVLSACGSALHTGLAAAALAEKLCRVPCRAVIASELRYSDALIGENTLAVFISQSGETADTLAAMRLAKEKGARVLSVVNTPGSAMALESPSVIYTAAGRETAVATTKAYSAQLTVLYALMIHIAARRGLLPEEEERRLVKELLSLPEKIALTLKRTEPAARELAKTLADAKDMFFIGRLSDRAAAEEASLKMKEVSYINSQAYAAGELKHGTISLIEQGTPVIAIATRERVFTKTCSNLAEVKARGARTILVTNDSFLSRVYDADTVIALPDIDEAFSCSLSVIPMQLLSYYTAKERGCDIDKPKNLAKSVTVE